MQYTQSHTWVCFQEKEGKVGLSAYGQGEIGEIVYVELPRVGEFLQKGDPLAVVESTKAATDLYSPISGKVVAVNQELQERPHLLNSSPEEKGWIAIILVSSLEEKSGFLSPREYQELI